MNRNPITTYRVVAVTVLQPDPKATEAHETAPAGAEPAYDEAT
jgi:hypothetical protein